MCLLLRKTGFRDLCMREHTDNRAVLAYTLELALERLAAVLCVLFGVAGECLLLGAVPVLVKPTFELGRQVGRPDGAEGAQSPGSLYITNSANNDERGCLDDGDRLDDLALVHFRSWTIEITDYMGHARFVAHECSQVDGFLGVILWERLDFSSVASRPLPGEEAKGAMARRFVLTMTERGV